MNELQEYEMVAFFIGKTVTEEALPRLIKITEYGLPGYEDCEVFTTMVADWTKTADAIDTEFSILLFVKNERLVGVRLRKYKTIHFTDGIISGYETTPTEEEIETAKYILAVITGN